MIFASSGDNGAAQPTCDNFLDPLYKPSPLLLVTRWCPPDSRGDRAACGSLLPGGPGCDPASNPLPGTYEGEIAWNEVATRALEPPWWRVRYSYDEP